MPYRDFYSSDFNIVVGEGGNFAPWNYMERWMRRNRFAGNISSSEEMDCLTCKGSLLHYYFAAALHAFHINNITVVYFRPFTIGREVNKAFVFDDSRFFFFFDDLSALNLSTTESLSSSTFSFRSSPSFPSRLTECSCTCNVLKQSVNNFLWPLNSLATQRITYSKPW